MVLGQKQGAIRLKDLCLEMELGEEETLSFLRQVFPVGIGIEIYHENEECWVDIDASSIQYMLPLSPAEWMHLSNILSHHVSVTPSPVSYGLQKKLVDNGPMKVVMELLNQLEIWDQELNESQKEIINRLEHDIAEKNLVRICSKEGKEYHVFPCKVLHLEGELSLIAEDSQDHCLMIISLRQVGEIDHLEIHSSSKVTEFEVEEFIAALRALNEKETRLILKIHNPQAVNLFPDHHFLGKPCMVTNPIGDLIWAAYVEPCDALFEWLLTLGTSVEILDPGKFKHEYLMYCEEKLRKIA